METHSRGRIWGLFGAASLLASCAAAAHPPALAQPPQPPLPIFTQLDYWDDHWFWWLPSHPLYESVEVAAREPDTNGRRDVWVWLTERAGVKRQVHYRNNPALLQAPPSILREFDFKVTGKPSGPRGIRLNFTDEKGVPISLSMEVSDPLQRTNGLTSQSGHAADQIFLLFYRQQQAYGTDAAAEIGGRNYAFKASDAPGAQRYRWSYSHGIYAGGFPFRDIQGNFGPDGYEPVPGKPGVVARTLPDGKVVTLSADASGRLAQYSYVMPGNRALVINFSPALPRCDNPADGGASGFRISLADLPNAVNGEVLATCGPGEAAYSWRPAAPSWAVRSQFTSTFTRSPDGRFQLSVKPAARVP